MTRRTPTKPKQQKEINVEEELITRTILLFSSNYDNTIPIDRINYFPPVQNPEDFEEQEYPEFNSALVQHRLQRRRNKINKEIQNENQNIQTTVEYVCEKLQNFDHDLSECFAVEKANRQLKPKYLANMDKDIEDEKLRRQALKHQTKQMDMKTIYKEQMQRLEASRQRGIENVQKRKERAEQMIKNSDANQTQYYQSKLSPYAKKKNNDRM